MKESGEMYLETILVLNQKMDHVRSINVAESMGFSKPSVSNAISKLKGEGCLAVSPEGYLSLTEKGHAIASKIYERHVLLTKLLVSVGVDENTARQDACKVEHDISDETFEALKKHINAVQS